MKVPPGPRGRAAYGFLGGRGGAGTIEFLNKTARNYGAISSFRIFGKRIYLIDDAELIREILVTRQHEFVRDTGANLLRELVGDGLITREEPQHKERRRVLQPAFHRDQIASYVQIMAGEVEEFSAKWTNGGIVDIRREMRRLTLSIVGASLFGSDLRESADAVADVLGGVARKSVFLAPAITFFEPLVLTYRRYFPRGPSLFFRKERSALERIIDPIIQAGRAHPRSAAGKGILDLILSGMADEEKPLTDEEVRNELVTFVLAGHETTATALTWTWYLLGRHPHVADQTQAEVDSVLSSGPLDLGAISRLKYTSQVFDEALRLYPPALAFARRPKQRLQLGGYEIPRGASIFLSPYVTQRNERYFERPESFEPERWKNPIWPKFAYFPFGGGAKMCIGEPFARIEGVIALAILTREWRLSSADSFDAAASGTMLLQPDRAINMRLVSRGSVDSIRGYDTATVRR